MGEVIRAGIHQIDSWKTFIESNFLTIAKEFQKYTNQSLPREFYNFDSSRMHYAVVAGRREHFSDNTRILQRRLEHQQNIKLLHYDNLLDDAMRLIGHQTY